MTKRWPSAVVSQADADAFCKCMFPDCRTENMFAGVEVCADIAGQSCGLIRVKNAVKHPPFSNWPDHLESIFKYVSSASSNGDLSYTIKARNNAGAREIIYYSSSFTSNPCTCRILLGGDKSNKMPLVSVAWPATNYAFV